MSDTRRMSDGQRLALRKLIGDVPDKKRLWIASQLAGREITSFGELTVSDWRRIRNRAYPRWSENDWTVGSAFASELAGLRNQYDETISGQMRLF